MNIYDNNKQLLDVLGGKSQNLSTDFEVRKAILELLGGNSNSCNSIYDIDLQILKIFQEGGGNIPESGGNCEELEARVEELNGVISLLQQEVDLLEGEKNMVYAELEQKNEQINSVSSLTITENGTYTPPTDVLGYNLITVDVAGGGNAGGCEKLKVSKLEVNNNCIVDGTWDGDDGIDTSNVTGMSYMFNGCSSLQSLNVSGWDTSNVTGMSYMFNGCSSLQSLNVSGWDTSNVTSMNYMFNNCTSLQTLNVSGWDTINVTGMNSMFSSCRSLQSLDVSGWDTSKVTIMSYMFSSCRSLQSLDVSGWDTSKVTNINYIFGDCINLTTLIGGRTIDEVISNNISALNGLKINISLSITTIENIDRASLRALINGLADLTGSTSRTLTLGSTLIAKLTEEDIAVATAKNWTIS